MRCRAATAAVLLGLCSAWGAGLRRPPGRGRPGPLTPESAGAIREIAIHYLPAAAAITARTYREFLRWLPEEVVVYAVVPNRRAFEDLARRVGATASGSSRSSWPIR